MNGRPFSARDDHILRTMWAQGKSSVEIALRLARRDTSVRRRAGILGLARRDAEETEHLAKAGRAATSMRPIYSQSVAERVKMIRGHFARLSDRLDAWGAETDRLARDMGFA